jgi:hypothetical protein
MHRRPPGARKRRRRRRKRERERKRKKRRFLLPLSSRAPRSPSPPRRQMPRPRAWP